MKKLYFLLFAMVGTFAMAQVTFKPGVRAGVNFSKFTNGDAATYSGNNWYSGSSNSSDFSFAFRPDFYIGFQGNIRFSQLYALQPEVNYTRQGTVVNFKDNGQNKSNNISVSYTGVTLTNKFHIDKFNVLVGPYLEFQTSQKNVETDLPFDFGITAGAGFDITENIGIEARVKKGFFPVIVEDNTHSTFIVQAGAYFSFK